MLSIDDQEIADNLNDYLLKRGYASRKAYTGEQGLDLVESQKPHVALIDFRLPDINGIELLKSIKAASPDTIILLISA